MAPGPYGFINKIWLSPWVDVGFFTKGTWPMGGPMGPYGFINEMGLSQSVHIDLLTDGTWAQGRALGTLWIYKQNVLGPMGPCRFSHTRYLGPWVGPWDPMDL